MSRPIRAVILLLFCFILLVACREGNNHSGNENGTGEPAGATTIRFADAGFKEALYQPLMDAFAAENPGYEIEYVPVEEAVDRQSGVLDLFALASLADTMILPRRAAAAEAGYFQDINGRVAESDYWSEALAACRAGDTQVAFPLFVTPTLVFVHGDLFAAAGVPVPEPGWNWNAFAEATSTIGAAEDVFGFAQGNSPAELFAPTIDRLLPADRSGLDPAELSAATDWYADLVQQGAIWLPAQAEDPQQLIEAGQVAMWLDSPATLPTMRNRLDANLAVLPFPQSEPTESSTPVQPACAAISAGTSQSEMAWAWLDYLAQNPFVSRRGEIPGRNDIAESSGFWTGLDQDVAAAYRYALDHAWYGGMDSAIETVAAALDRALQEGVDIEIAIGEIETLPTPTPVPTAAATPMVAEEAPAAIIEGEEGMIRFFNNSFETNKATVREIAADFTAQTGLQFQFHDFSNIGAAGGPPTDNIFATVASSHDCIMWHGPLPLFFQSQVIPIEELLNERYPEVLADYASFTLEQARYDEVLYGLPVVLEPQTLFVNADRFERKDIPLPTTEWTVEDVERIAAEMPLGEGRSQIYGFVPVGDFNMDAYEPLLALYGAMPFDLGASPPAVFFNDPVTIAALEQISPLIAEGIVAPYDGGGTRSAQGNANEIDQIIESGRGTIWNENLAVPASRFRFVGAPYSTKPVPYPSSPVPLPAPNMVSFYILEHATNPEACLDWIVTLSDNPQVAEGIPARVSWRESAGWAAEVGAEQAAILRDTANRSTKLPANGSLYYPVFDWWEDALVEIWNGAEAAEVLGAAQEKAETYIACIDTTDLSTDAVGESTQQCALEADPNYPLADLEE